MLPAASAVNTERGRDEFQKLRSLPRGDVIAISEIHPDPVTGAFSGTAAAGGLGGAGVAQAMRYGVARGLFSN
jgi:hypothetical protein